MSPFLKKLSTYIKKERYSNFGTFEIASLVNVLGHYLRKYGTYVKEKYINFVFKWAICSAGFGPIFVEKSHGLTAEQFDCLTTNLSLVSFSASKGCDFDFNALIFSY